MNRSLRWAALAGATLLTGLLQACAPTLPLAIKPVGCTVADNTLALQCAAQIAAHPVGLSNLLVNGLQKRSPVTT